MGGGEFVPSVPCNVRAIGVFVFVPGNTCPHAHIGEVQLRSSRSLMNRKAEHVDQTAST